MSSVVRLKCLRSPQLEGECRCKSYTAHLRTDRIGLSALYSIPQMDVVGFDTNVPTLISDFCK